MADSGTIGLSRVTIVTPRARVDLALPSDVPLADLLPTLLRLVNEQPADDSRDQYGWSLARLPGTPLDITRTPDQLEVRDGEMLYLLPNGEVAPEPVFDDEADAIATATLSRSGRWTAATTRRVGLWLGGLALLGGAAVVVFAGPPQLPGVLVGWAMALVLVAAGTAAARALGDRAVGTALALPAMGYAFAGGALMLAGGQRPDELSSPHLLLGATAAVLMSALGAMAVGSVRGFFAAGIGAAGLAVGAVVEMVAGVGAAGAAAVVVGLGLLALPSMPMIALRLAKVPVSSIPVSPEDLRAGDDPVDQARLFARADLADQFLSELLVGLALLTAGTAGTLALTASSASLALTAILGLLLLVRAREFPRVDQRLPLLVVGIGALAASGLAVFVGAGLLVRLAVVLVLTVVLAAAGILSALLSGRRPAPTWSRAVDIIEVLLATSVIPLILWASGLYTWVRSLSALD